MELLLLLLLIFVTIIETKLDEGQRNIWLACCFKKFYRLNQLPIKLIGVWSMYKNKCLNWTIKQMVK